MATPAPAIVINPESESRLFNEMQAIRSLLVEMSQEQGRQGQKIESLDERLYNHGSGNVPVIFQRLTKVELDVAGFQVNDMKENIKAASKKASDAMEKVTEQRAWVAGWAAGAAAFVTLVVFLFKAMLGKIGLHLS